MRSDWLMTLALRWMGNLVTDEDRDRAARVWRWAGRRSLARDDRPPFTLTRRRPTHAGEPTHRVDGETASPDALAGSPAAEPARSLRRW